MEFTTQELAPIAEELATLFEQKIKGKEGRHIGSLEHEVRKGMNELAVMVLSKTLALAEKEREQTIDCECGGKLHYQRRREAKFESTFGWVSYKRDYYAGCKCKKGISPLDDEFGIIPGEITPELARLLAITGAELPYGESRKLVKEFLLLELSPNSVREETQRFGQYQQEREKQLMVQTQNENYLQKRTQIEKAMKHAKRLYGSLDGAHVRINDPAEDEDWREVKVGCWYEVEAVPSSQKNAHQHKMEAIGKQALRAKGQQYYCDIQKADDFAPLFWATGCQAKVDLAEEVVFLGDGAKWIWKLVTYFYPKAVQIVDWFHAEERLETVAKDAFPKSSERKEWLENIRYDLWEGSIESVIRACELLALHSKEATEARTCFYNNKKRMQYDRFREEGYMIGSGTIESACKQIVSHRLRCSGAQWKVEGARLTAKARAAWLSKNNDWEIIASMRAKLPLAI